MTINKTGDWRKDFDWTDKEDAPVLNTSETLNFLIPEGRRNTHFSTWFEYQMKTGKQTNELTKELK